MNRIRAILSVLALAATATGSAAAVRVGKHTCLIQGFEGPDVLAGKKNVSYLSGVPEDAEVEVWDTALYNARRIAHAGSGIACRIAAKPVTQGRGALSARFTRDDRALRISLRNNINQPSGAAGRPECNSLGCFDAVKIDVFNPAAKPVACRMTALGGFAVTDKSRSFALVRDLTLKSGWNTVTLTSPDACAVFVDPHDTTCVEFRVPKAKDTTLLFDNVRMERETIGENMAKFARCFDFGVSYFNWPGFTYGSVPWDAKRGYGFTAGKSLTHGGDMHVVNDQLTRDGFRAPAAFRVKVPNGKYKVVTRTGNYWGRRAVGLNVEIKAEGKRVYYRGRLSARKQAEFKYAHERTDHGKRHPDLWGTYEDGTFFPEVRFDAEVADGVLDLEFLLPPVADGRASGESVWNYLIIYPADKHRAIAPEIDWLNEKIRTIYNTVSHAEIGRAFALYNREEVICPDEFLWPDIAAARRKALKPTAAETKRGYLHFIRDKHDLMTPDSVPLPGEIGNSLTAFGTPGETASFAVGLYPLADLKQVTVELSDVTDAAGKTVVPAAGAEVRLLSYRPMTPVTSNHAECFHIIGPGVLIPPQPTDVPKAFPRKWWISMPIPKDAAPGVLRATVHFKVNGRNASAVKVALVVLPFALDKPKGVTFAVAHNSVRDFWASETNHELAFYARLGLTTIWYQGDAALRADMRQLAARHGLAVELGSRNKYLNWRWPENYRHALIRRYLARGQKVSFTPRHTGHREGRKIRFTHGFWLWRSGIRHRVIQTQPNACERVYYAHCGHAKFGPCSYRFPSIHQVGLILPAPTLYEVRDGIIDWRYIQTLENLAHPPGGRVRATPAMAAGQKFLAELKKAIDPSLDRYYFQRKRNFNHVGRFGLHDTVWTGRRYLLARWELARHIAAIHGKPIRADAVPIPTAESPGVVRHAEYFGPFWVDASQFMYLSQKRAGTPTLQAENPRTPVGQDWATVLVKMTHPSKARWTAVLKDSAGKELARQPVGELKRWKTRWVLATSHLPAGRYTLAVVAAGAKTVPADAPAVTIDVVPWVRS